MRNDIRRRQRHPWRDTAIIWCAAFIPITAALFIVAVYAEVVAR